MLKWGGTKRPEVQFGRGSDSVASALVELAGVTGKAVLILPDVLVTG